MTTRVELALTAVVSAAWGSAVGAFVTNWFRSGGYDRIA